MAGRKIAPDCNGMARVSDVVGLVAEAMGRDADLVPPLVVIDWLIRPRWIRSSCQIAVVKSGCELVGVSANRILRFC
jgi:hypothetical protein